MKVAIRDPQVTVRLSERNLRELLAMLEASKRRADAGKGWREPSLNKLQVEDYRFITVIAETNERHYR